MRLDPEQRVSIVAAEERALSALSRARLTRAAQVAAVIWPDHDMKAQGAGAAASRILKRLQKRGLVFWTARGDYWGWRLT